MSAIAQKSERDARWDELIGAERAVEAALARKFGSLRVEKRAELIRDAELELIEQWSAGTASWPADPAAWLVRAVGNDARDLAKRKKRRATEAAGVAGADFEAGAAPAAEADHERLLAEENARGLYALLSPTQRHIAVLRFSAGLEPRTIAKQLKLSRRAVYRHLNAIASRLRAPAAELVDGDFPNAWGELIFGHVAGTLSPRDRAKAAALLEANSDARLFALQLQRAGDQLAALIPPTALLAPPESSNPLARMADRLDGLVIGIREAIENSAAAVKQQVVNAFGRTVDVTPVIASSPRSGAGAILASCVLASGGTVCVITGTTPDEFADIFGQQQNPKITRKAPTRKPMRAPVTATARPTPTPRPKPRPKPRVTAAPTPRQAPTPPPQQAPTPPPDQASPSAAPPAVTGDFGPQPEAPAQPAPAPIDGPGEFGP